MRIQVRHNRLMFIVVVVYDQDKVNQKIVDFTLFSADVGEKTINYLIQAKLYP